MNQSITDLTNAVFDASGLKDTQIAKRISLGQAKVVTRQVIGNYRRGEKFLRYNRLVEIADLLDVRIDFTVAKIETFL